MKKAAKGEWPMLPMAERQARCAQLRRLSAKKRYDQMEAALGSEQVVLFENPRDALFPVTPTIICGWRPRPGRFRPPQPPCRVRLEAIRGDWVECRVVAMMD